MDPRLVPRQHPHLQHTHPHAQQHPHAHGTPMTVQPPVQHPSQQQVPATVQQPFPGDGPQVIITEQPPDRCIYKRNVKPAPVVVCKKKLRN